MKSGGLMNTRVSEPSRSEIQLSAFLRQARINSEKMQRFQQMEMRLLTAGALTELIRTVLEDCRETFGLEAVGLTAFDPEHELRALLEGASYDWRSEPRLQFTTTVSDFESLYGGRTEPLLGAFHPERHRRLFPGLDLTGGSIAMLPIRRLGLWIGSLNFVSSDPRRYIPEMSTDFLAHLGALLAICLENTAIQERLRRSMLVDKLTGVNNRRFFDRRLSEEVDRGVRQDAPLACLFIDIDHFKRLNDTYGHQVGDEVIACVARRIRSQLRGIDVLARYGGEEFTVLLSSTGLERALEVAERVRQDIAGNAVTTSADEPIRCSVSIGVACVDSDHAERDLDKRSTWLVTRADQALYRAKQSGRNRVVATRRETEGILLSA
jgi:diguanylate cyclase (GGDEF)-like protein